MPKFCMLIQFAAVRFVLGIVILLIGVMAWAQYQLPDGIQADEPLEYRANDIWQTPQSSAGHVSSLSDLVYFPRAGGGMFDVGAGGKWATVFDKNTEPDNDTSGRTSTGEVAAEGFFAFNPMLALGAGAAFQWASVKILSETERGSGYTPYVALLLNPLGHRPSSIQLQARIQAGLHKDISSSSADDNDYEYDEDYTPRRTKRRDNIQGFNLGAALELGVKASPFMQVAFTLNGTKNMADEDSTSNLITGMMLQVSPAPAFHIMAGGVYTGTWNDTFKTNGLNLAGGIKVLADSNMALYVNGEYLLWMRMRSSRNSRDNALKDLRTRAWGLTAGLRMGI